MQVHPRDDYAHKHHQSLGKTEAWYVVAAEPDAEVAVGFKEPITAQRLEESARSGEIEDLLDWRRIKAGDAIFVPAEPFTPLAQALPSARFSRIPTSLIAFMITAVRVNCTWIMVLRFRILARITTA